MDNTGRNKRLRVAKITSVMAGVLMVSSACWADPAVCTTSSTKKDCGQSSCSSTTTKTCTGTFTTTTPAIGCSLTDNVYSSRSCNAYKGIDNQHCNGAHCSKQDICQNYACVNTLTCSGTCSATCKDTCKIDTPAGAKKNCTLGTPCIPPTCTNYSADSCSTPLTCNDAPNDSLQCTASGAAVCTQPKVCPPSLPSSMSTPIPSSTRSIR